MYAESGVPEYWIVNLVDGCVEVYREPVESRYGVALRFERGQTILIQRFPDVEVRVSDLIW